MATCSLVNKLVRDRDHYTLTSSLMGTNGYSSSSVFDPP